MIKIKPIVKGMKPYLDRDTGEEVTPIGGNIYFPKGTELTEASKFHNKDSVLLTLEEYRQLTKGDFSINKITAIKYAKELIEEAHDRLCEAENEAISEVNPIPEEE